MRSPWVPALSPGWFVGGVTFDPAAQSGDGAVIVSRFAHKDSSASVAWFKRLDGASIGTVMNGNTGLNYPISLAFDPTSDELFACNQLGNSVSVLPGTYTSSDTAALRILEGDLTGIGSPGGVVVSY